MGRAYSMDLRQRVISYIERGHSCRAAGRYFQIGEKTAINWWRRYQETGSFAPFPSKGSTSPLDEAANTKLILSIVELTPDITRAELQDTLARKGLKAAPSSLTRFFRRHGLTLKKNRLCR